MTAPVVRPGAAAKAARVTLLLLDVDGVLTDGGIVYDDGGREIKRFHVRDGHGIKMLQRAGVAVGIITGRTSGVVAVRARELGISLVRQGAADKVAAWRDILGSHGEQPGGTAYVGDDIVDLPLMKSVGFAAAPADAEPYVIEAADFVSSRPGGHGAVREIAEFILRAGGRWDAAAARYFGDGSR
jgi:3-deoxy-D-manno-octulosonate 8-phosphate phosphatase (KDO 8-P phosphatase)